MVKWKPKMKLKCLDCGSINKHVVSKIHNHEYDLDYKSKCTKCGEANCITEDLLREMQEDAVGAKNPGRIMEDTNE